MRRWIFSLLMCILTAAAVLPTSQVRAVSGTISGTVFRDFNANGALDVQNPVAGVTAGDFGVPGITVTAFGPGGYTETQVTDVNGNYTFNSPTLLALPDNSEIRIEFTGIPAGFYTTVNGGTGGGVANTSVRFVRTTLANLTNIDFGVQIPGEYCQNNPDLATTCFVNGDPTQAGSTVAGIPSWVGFAYNSNGSVPTPPDYTIGTASQVGSLWGIAYQRTTNRVFAAAALHAGAGLGQGGTGTSNATGAIYVLNSGAGGPALFVNFDALATPIATRPAGFPDNAGRGLPGSPTATTTIVDSAAASVGSVGFGDIDVSEDQASLWAVNLFDQRLYKINIPPAGTLATNADITSFAIPNQCGTDTMHPWGLKPHNGKVYVGVICESLNVTPRAYIVELDALTGAATGAPTFPFFIDLSYSKGQINNGDPTPEANNWTWWQDPTVEPSGPQPILSDIEFDMDGSMVLGFLDRAAMARPRLGPGDTPDAPPKPAGGEILRLCSVAGGYQLENNGLCPNSPPGKLSYEPFAPALPAQGPGGGEFYFDNFSAAGVPNHQEIAIGGLALLPGSGEVVSSTFNPNNDQVFSGGVRHFDNITGETRYGYALYTTGTFTNNGYAFGKGVGIGDLELLCQMAPVEIGNRVWLDLNKDGIQTPEEPVIPGVTVELVDSVTGQVFTAVTDANGTYYFSNGPDLGLGNTSAVYNLPLVFGRQYTIRIPLNQVALLPYLPTLLDADGSANGDSRDSDGNPALIPGYVATVITLGAAGQNNHTYDFGFFDAPTPTPTNTSTPTDTPTSTATPTATNTPTDTPTSTPTSTDTPTNTPTPTATNTPTDTPTNTPTPTFTDTPTDTPTSTPTSSLTVTPTETPTPTSTDTPTDTPTPTDTASPTVTASASPTETETPTPTESETPTATGSPSETPTETPTGTIFTETPTPTPTGTLVTDTPTPTPTGTLSTLTPSPSSVPSNPTPNLQFADPRLDKSVDPALAVPGDIVTFTITASNIGTAPTGPVTVTDTLNEALDIISATTSQGTYTFSGRTFTFNIGVIQPGQVVTMTITCRLRPDAHPPFDVLNTASMNGQIATASLKVRSNRPSLPATGLPPAPSDSDVNLATAAFVLGIVLVALVLYRRRRTPQNS